MKRRLLLTVAVCAACATPLHAQIGTGDIYGTVTDESGGTLPGATVTIDGPFSRATASDASGRFRLLRLEAGTYRLTVELAGFTAVRQSVRVTTGRNVSLTFRLLVASLEESLTVLAETPVVDPKQLGTGTTVDKTEAVRVPNARDIWAVLRTVPGVVTSGTNVAGEQNGQQVAFAAKGAAGYDNMWSLDGVQIDDMAAAGATPTYFDYDFFEEVAVTTGGNPVNVQTGGVGLNFVTRRGTNRWHGSLKGYLTHDALAWSNIAGTEFESDPRLQREDGSFSDQADHVRQISDYGFDLGGPILRDRLFVYGLYGRQDIRQVRTDQNPDKTLLETFTAKLNWQVGPDTQASLFWFNGKKTKLGRQQIGGWIHDPTALWDQGAAYEDFLPLGIHGMLKVELNHVVGPRLFLHADYTNYDTGFGLVPRSTGPGTLDFANGAVRGSGWVEVSPITRPIKHMTNVDATAFLDGWGGQHELKFGFGYKRAPASSTSSYGGLDTGLLGWNWGPGISYVWVNRPGALRFEGKYLHAFAADTFTKGPLTVTAGARFDHQSAKNTAGDVPSSPSFPELLPAIDYPGGGVGIEWSDLAPRLGASWALDEKRKTLARAAFSTYASKLSNYWAVFENPVKPSYLAYLWNDLNGDGLPQAEEVDLDSGLQYYGGVDPADPAALETPDTIDPDLVAPRDYEAILGLDREILPDLAASVAYTWRRGRDVMVWAPRIGLTAADFTANPPVTENGFTARTFSPDPALVAASGGGRFFTNRPDYHRTYHGLELTLEKRMSRGWMMRVAFSWMDWREHFDGPGAVQNPTRTARGSGWYGWAGPSVDGGLVPAAGGSFKGLSYLTSTRWQLAANGLVELPWGLEVGGSLFGRQGSAQPIALQLGAGLDGRVPALATPELDTRRYPDVWNLDLRLARRVRLGGAQLALEASVFNVLNSSTELTRFLEAQSNAFLRLDGILHPRIVRLGARLTF